MPDDEPGSPPGTDPGARRQRREGDEAGAATLTAVDSGESLARGAGGDDTDEIASVVRTAETASDTAEVEDLQHWISCAVSCLPKLGMRRTWPAPTRRSSWRFPHPSRPRACRGACRCG